MRQLYGKYYKMFASKNDRQDESLTSQVHDQAGHCPLTGHYFEPCTSLAESKIYNYCLNEAKLEKLHIFRSVDKSAFWLQDIDISTALVVSMK